MNAQTNIIDLSAERKLREEQRKLLQQMCKLLQQTALHYDVQEVPLEAWLNASIKAGDRRRKS